jgi:hypothetical protein
LLHNYQDLSNKTGQAHFGFSVAVRGDTLAVGASTEEGSLGGVSTGAGDTLNDFSAAGAVYLYRRENGMWNKKAYVKALTPGNIDEFGFSVGLSGDTLAVGALGESSHSGAVYLFE